MFLIFWAWSCVADSQTQSAMCCRMFLDRVGVKFQASMCSFLYYIPQFIMYLGYNLVILFSLFQLLLTLNSIQLQYVERVRQARVIGVEISNFFNYQYYSKIALGTPTKQFDVILDTGSHHLWIPSVNCTNCGLDSHYYDINKSSTGSLSIFRDHLKYGKGEVEGTYAKDLVEFAGFSAQLQFLLVDKQKDTEHSQADGIMGLSNWKKKKNILDVAYKQGKISSSKFGFKLGVKQLRQKSHFFYNITQDDFPEAAYLNASNIDYWTISLLDLKVDNISFGRMQALVDSGTSLMVIPPKLYKSMDQSFFSSLCDPYIPNQLRNCKCPSKASLPNITVRSTTLSFNITPQSYLLGSYSSRYCKLAIQPYPSNDLQFIILGDIFFHGRTIIFDKEENKIGFISEQTVIRMFPQNQDFILALDVISILCVAVCLLVLFLRRKNSKKQIDLNEPFQGKSLEMTRN